MLTTAHYSVVSGTLNPSQLNRGTFALSS